MRKALRSLAFCLSFLMVLNLFSVVAFADDQNDKVVITAQRFGPNEFNDLAASGLTTEMDGKFSVSTRQVSIGNRGYGIWAYISPSVGNYLDVVAGHKYICEAQVWVEDYISPDPSTVDWTDSVDNWFNADCWIYSPNKTYTSTPLTRQAYEAAPTYYDETYGYPYKVIEMTSEIPETDKTDGVEVIPAGSSEFRIYTNGFTRFKHYRMFVYDEDDPLTPVLDMDASVSNPYNVVDHLADPENYVECDNLSLNPGLYLSVEKSKNCTDTVLVGNAGKTIPAGNYAFEYALDYTFIRENSVVFSVDITKNGQHYGGETFTAENLPENGILSIPFEADEEADYRAALCINDNASFTLKSIELKRTIDQSYFDGFKNAVEAIGEVKYDPDVPEDSGELIKAARKAYDDIVNEFGDVSEITNVAALYSTFVSAETKYAALVSEYNDMLEAAKTVEEAIESIPGSDSEDRTEYIINAGEAFDSFVNTFGEEKAKLHIKNHEKLIGIWPLPPVPPVSFTYGDVNADGNINSEDALCVLQSVVGIIELNDNAKLAADVNLDQKIDTEDALAILQYIVKIVEELPVGERR